MGRDCGRQVALDFGLFREYYQRFLALSLLGYLQFELAELLQTNDLQTVSNHHGVNGSYHVFVEDACSGEAIHQSLVEGVELLCTGELDKVNEFNQTVGALSRGKDGSGVADRRVCRSGNASGQPASR